MKTLLTGLIAVLPACGGAQMTLEDQGKVCVTPGADPFVGGALAADGSVTIHVILPTCLSSSCTTEREASCSVTQEGGTLRVTSRGSYRNVFTGACTEDCVRLMGHCATGPLPAGSYTIVHAGVTTPLTIPGSAARDACF